jgi:hypothetical protein
MPVYPEPTTWPNLPSAMKPSPARTPFLFLLLLALCMPLDLQAVETGDTTPSEAPPAVQAAPPPAEGTVQPASDGQPREQQELQALRQRYRQDPTGVRARLGMCRRGQGGHGGGHYRHRHGDERWPTP